MATLEAKKRALAYVIWFLLLQTTRKMVSSSQHMPFLQAYNFCKKIIHWCQNYSSGMMSTWKAYSSRPTCKRRSRGLLMKFRRQSFSIFMKTEQRTLLPFIGAPLHRRWRPPRHKKFCSLRRARVHGFAHFYWARQLALISSIRPHFSYSPAAHPYSFRSFVARRRRAPDPKKTHCILDANANLYNFSHQS